MYNENNNELLHYGVKGMRWGVRRATKALSKATTDEKREKALNRLEKHRAKASRKVEKLDKARPKLERKVERAVTKIDVKAARYNRSALRYEGKANSLISTKGLRNYHRSQASKMRYRANELTAMSNEYKAKLAQNEAMTKAFKQGINDIDDALVEYGRKYVRG